MRRKLTKAEKRKELFPLSKISNKQLDSDIKRMEEFIENYKINYPQLKISSDFIGYLNRLIVERSSRIGRK